MSYAVASGQFDLIVSLDYDGMDIVGEDDV